MQENFIINEHLDGDSFFFKGNQTGILLVHGFTASTAEVRYLAERLHEQGYSVMAPLLPGHLTSPDDLNRIHWHDWVHVVEKAYYKLKEQCSHVWVGGESMGGLLSLYLAAKNPEIKGILLFAPALVLRSKQTNLAHILQFFKKYLQKNGKKDDLAWKGYNVYPLKATVQMLRLQVIVRRMLPDVHQPALICMARKDLTVAPETAEILMQQVNSPVKELIWFEESPHVMLLAQEKDKIFVQTVDFILENT